MLSCTQDIRNLLRAYNLLVATRDDERAIAGKVSRDWLKTEREDWVRLVDLDPGVFSTVRGREILCEAMMPDLDSNPESVDLEPLLQQIPFTDKLVNSNSFAKLEPAIASEVLLGAMLLGVQRYGNRGTGVKALDNDLIVAAMVRSTIGLTDRYSAVLPLECTTVEIDTIEELFGETISTHLLAIKDVVANFNDAYKADALRRLKLPHPYANVIAAEEASQLRLIARAAGDEILANLDADKKAELNDKGIRCDGDFPEGEWLQAQYDRTRAAFALDGVDYGALVEPLETTLLMAVADTLEQPSKRRRLVGRRGKAVRDTHNSLPLVESFNASENVSSIATLHVAALELMHFLEKGRRKSTCTMLGHSLRIAAVAEKLFGESLEPAFAATAILHDVVEDGCRPVAGYDQSLNNIKQRFGGPLAAMVAELTDAESSVAGQQKAEATLQCDSLILPEQQYNFDRFTEMPLQATAPHEPYTLGGIITKIIDTAISEEEGIRDPDVMASWWKHSGIRVYWSYNVRGKVVRPLLIKLTQEIEKYVGDPESASPVLNDELVAGLLSLIEFSINSSDKYAVQNLAIIAHEYGLDDAERERLINAFFNADIDQATFASEIVDTLLVEGRLKNNIRSGLVPSECYVALYSKLARTEPKPEADTFIRYRDAALQRAQIAARLGLDQIERVTPSPLSSADTNAGVVSASIIGEVVSLYDLRKVA